MKWERSEKEHKVRALYGTSRSLLKDLKGGHVIPKFFKEGMIIWALGDFQPLQRALKTKKVHLVLLMCSYTLSLLANSATWWTSHPTLSLAVMNIQYPCITLYNVYSHVWVYCCTSWIHLWYQHLPQLLCMQQHIRFGSLCDRTTYFIPIWGTTARKFHVATLVLVVISNTIVYRHCSHPHGLAVAGIDQSGWVWERPSWGCQKYPPLRLYEDSASPVSLTNLVSWIRCLCEPELMDDNLLWEHSQTGATSLVGGQIMVEEPKS